MVVIFLLGGLGFLALSKKNEEEGNRVCFRNYCFKVELARTEAERRQGLMFRKNLGENEGMFFIFEEEGVYPFWMQNTFLPLDIIWIDKNFQVVYLSENTPPCKKDLPCLSINPRKKAKYALEIKGGGGEKNWFGHWSKSKALWGFLR